MDKDGYPTKKEIARVGAWEPTDFHGLAAFLVEMWRYDTYVSLEGDVLRISTGGWSGHETLIEAIPGTWWRIHFWSHRRGGHFVFTCCGKDPEGER